VPAGPLEAAVAMTGRQLQRIEQGMGRGIRSRDDYCVVMLLGARLIRRLHDPGAFGHFSAATTAQLQLSRQVAELLGEGNAGDLRAAVEQCLARDQGWVRASRNALVGVTYGSGSVAPTAENVRRAADLAGQQRYTEAVDAQQRPSTPPPTPANAAGSSSSSPPTCIRSTRYAPSSSKSPRWTTTLPCCGPDGASPMCV
jgi:hypothetical protein